MAYRINHGWKKVDWQKVASIRVFDPVAQNAWNKHRLWHPIDNFTPDPSWETKAAEVTVEGLINGIPVKGKLDAPTLWNGKWWDLQWKTYSGDLGALIESVRLSWHQVMYQEVSQQNTMTPWGGTIIGACAKLPEYRNVNGHRRYIEDEERNQCFTYHYVTRSPDVQERMVDDLSYFLEQMYQLKGTPRNYDQCFGPFGHKCPYFEVCHEGKDLQGRDFKDAEDRYAI